MRSRVSPRLAFFGQDALLTLAIVLVSLGAVVGAGLLLIEVAPEELAADVAESERAEEIDRVRTAALAVLAGGVATAGAILTGLSYRLSRSGQVTERFTSAIDQIGNENNPLVRLGGIYALERIAYDSRRDHPRVMEVLTAYVRDPPPYRERAETPHEPDIDVQAAVAVLARRKHRYDEHRLDLSKAQLTGVKLPPKANLRGVDFAEAKLQHASLPGVDLRDRRFANEVAKADLGKADLTDAHLEGAELAGASLRGTILTGAHLDGAYLTGAVADGRTTPPDGVQQLEARGVRFEQ
jgi:hypothetical protein